MPRLPTRDDLGPLPSAGTGRPSSSINLGGEGRGLQQVGNAVSNLGNVLMERQRKKDVTNAEIAFQEWSFGERQALNTSSQNVSSENLDGFLGSWQETHGERSEQFVNSLPKWIQDEYKLKTVKQSNALAGDAINFTRVALKDRSTNNHKDRTDNIYKARIRAGDDPQEVYSDAYRAIKDDPDQDELGKEELWREISEEITLTQFDALSPEERIAAVDRIRAGRSDSNSLVKYESGGNPEVVNKWGYAGKYQFGAPRLVELGIYTPGKGETVKGNSSNWTGNKQAQWSGKWNIRGVNSLEDFLNNEEAQDRVFKKHKADIKKFIDREGLDQYIGETVNGVVITEDSIINMAHLGGKEGAKRYLESGGQDDPSDNLGTSLADYARLGAAVGDDELETIRDKAIQEQEASIADLGREAKLAYTAYKDNFEFRIRSHEVTDRNDIINDETLLDGDKATLLKAFGTEETRREKADSVERILGNGGNVNIYEGEDRKALDTVYNRMMKNVPEEEQQTTALQLVKEIGYVPDTLVKDIRSGLVSSDSQTAIDALTIAGESLKINPAAFAGREGAVGLAKDVDVYESFLEQGYEEKDALERWRGTKDLQVQKNRDAVLKDTQTVKWVKENSEPSDVTNAFHGWLTFEPEFVSEAQGFAIASQYQSMLEDALIDVGGDRDAAVKVAKARFGRVFGVSNLNMGGNNILMRYPPEKFYPKIQGGHDYVADQLSELVTQIERVQIDPDKVFLQSDEYTEDDIKAGRLPRYQVWFVDDYNIRQMLPGGHFVPDIDLGNEREEAKKGLTPRELNEINRYNRANPQDLSGETP